MTPGRSVVVVATGLQPGAHVTIGLTRAASSRRSGIVAGKMRVVPSSGRLEQRIRWPHRVYECGRANGATCELRRWGRARVLVTLGAPDLVAKTTVAAQTRVRVTQRGKASTARVNEPKIASVAQVLPGSKTCNSPWMSRARLTGTGYGSRIRLIPSVRARTIARSVPGALEDVWLDLQRCLGSFPSYTDATRSSLYKQLVCHIQWAVAPTRLTGGETWDLEAWAQDVSWAQALGNLSRKCNYGISTAAASAYSQWIVQDATDTKAQKTAWIVVASGGRLVRKHIPTIPVYDCLRQRRALGPVALDPTYLNDVVPVEAGDATCDALPAVPVPDTLPPYPEETPPAQPTPTLPATGGGGTASPPQTPGAVPETTGGVTNTWTNYTNAGGQAGQRIPAHTTVQIRCRLIGFKVQNGNRWWYRIASAPWNDAFYASADAFYNNGQTAGTLLGTPYVDERVPMC